jgi:hypothetical protein
MPIVAAFILVCFWFRDYMSLRMSPSPKALRRSLVYAGAILVTATFVWTLALIIGAWGFASRIESPRILMLLIAYHVAASLASIWVKRTGSYNWMWATTLLPAPAVWFVLLETTLLSGVGTPEFIFFAVAMLWAGSMIVVIFLTRHVGMATEDLDFAVVFGAMCHWLAIFALPLGLLVMS